MLFSDLGLAPELLRAIAEEGYTQPTPIQQQAIPVVLGGRDLLAAAQTGTGKTAAFTLPILHMLHGAGTAPKGLARVLVLVPTRELAAQVADSVRTYGRYLPLRTVVLFGGVGINPQIDALRKGVDVIVATPGRLLDHVQQGTLKLSGIQMLVLDEADRMLDMGFIRDIRRVFTVLPKQRQNLLFSATFNSDIRSLAESLLHNPASVDVAPRNTAAELVEQRAHPVDKSRKTALLAHLVKSGDWRQVLVFTRTKHGANRLADQLAKQGIETAAIHGNKSQSARTRALADFKAGKVRVLVATDIAARGIDIDQLPHVINHELPNVPEDYVHRIGRTGRAGAEGEAISLVSPDERAYLKDIQRLLKREIPSSIVPGFEPGSAAPEAERAEQAATAERPQHLRRPGHQPARHSQSGRPASGNRAGQSRHAEAHRGGNSHHSGSGRPARDGHAPARHSRPGGNKPRQGHAPHKKGS